MLMPEPRQIRMGGEVYIGYEGGRSEAFSEYGHRPWQKGFKDEKRAAVESAALDRFKLEWSVMQGHGISQDSMGNVSQEEWPLCDARRVPSARFGACQAVRRR